MRSLVVGLLICLGLAVGAAPAAAQPEPTQGLIEESQPRGRSGFWTNPNPAKGGSYRWRLLGIGGVLVGLTGFGMLRLVRRANAERAARHAR